MEPTFVIAGGQRCGTTSVYHLLAAHPQIYLAQPVRPEPKYFLHDPVPGRDRAWYVNTWFRDTGNAVAVGEKSTSYLESPLAAARMKRQFPGLKAIFILRHPVERAWSNYWFSRDAGLETLSFDEAVRSEERRVAGESFPEMSAHPFAYVRRGRYMDMLGPYFEHFAETDLYIALHDDLLSSPMALARRLYGFLGVETEVEISLGERRHNATSPPADERIERSTLEYLLAQYRASNRILADRLGRDLNMWNLASDSLARWTSS